MKPIHRRFLLAAASCLLAAACRDAEAPTGPGTPPLLPIQPLAAGGRTLAEFQCAATPSSGDLVCREPSAGAGGARAALLGQNQVKLTSSNVLYDTLTQIFHFDVRVKNLLGEPIGTPDGVTVRGLKVFYETGPSAATYVAPYDTGTVRAHNPDGTGHFTRADQPYYLYNQILQPQDSTPNKPWAILISRSVATVKFTVRVFTARPSEVPVPIASPASVPDWVYDEGKIIGTGNEMRLRNIVRIIYAEAATPEERQSAVDMIRGEVVGGARVLGTDGFYFVRIPDDSTGAALSSAVTRLDALPQVEFAGPEYLIEEGSRSGRFLPHDEEGWKRTQWDLDGPAGLNWGMEMISAPQAWGCSVGSTAFPVAVVDEGYHSLPDLTPNAPYRPIVDAFPTTDDHGTSVASVIGAVGNNAVGTTGVMQEAAMRLYEVRRRRGLTRLVFGSTDETGALSDAILSGARVVNISRYIPWDDDPAASDPLGLKNLRVELFRAEMRVVIGRLAQQGYRPLIVLIAGNNTGVDTYWSGYPRLADDFPTRVLVVGAVNASGAPAAFSSPGSRVHVMAPGDLVGGLKGNGDIVVDLEGTSFAAPHVAGIAGLLFAFDPRLTTEDVHQLIVDGAVASGRTAGGVPVADARESLKLAGRRPGAPLCGNPVWQNADGSVWTLRGPNWSLEEQLYTGTQAVVEPLHFGQAVRHGTGYYRWQPDGTWASGSAPPVVIPNASNRSRLGISHDGDSTVTATRKNGANARTDELWTVSLNGQAIITDMPGPKVNKVGSVSRCVSWDLSGNEFSNCHSSVNTWTDRVTAHSRVSISPYGDVVLMVYTEKSSYWIGNSYVYGGFWVRDHGLDVESDGTWIYFIDWETGIARELHVPIYDVRSMALSEDGRYAMLEKRNFFSSSTNTPDETFNSSFSTCNADYRRLNLDVAPITTSPLFSTPLVRNRADCYDGATFAP